MRFLKMSSRFYRIYALLYRCTGFRKAISCHYADSKNCYFIDVHGTTQENIATEIEAIVKKKGVRLTFVDVWKLKSRLVKGAPGTFQNIESHL